MSSTAILKLVCILKYNVSSRHVIQAQKLWQINILRVLSILTIDSLI